MYSYTNSIIVWEPSTMEWRNGPSLNNRTTDLVAVVCCDKVYAIGGLSSEMNYNNRVLDAIESIQVSSLLETTETSMMTRQNNSQWTRLQCHLSSPQQECTTVVVQNHYVVILGGHTGVDHYLSSVDIMDTAPHHDSNNKSNGEPTIVAGPSMNLAQHSFGAAVMDNHIFVVVGYDNGRQSTSVESLLFQWQPQDNDCTNSNSNVSWTFANSSWRMEPHLYFSGPELLMLWPRWYCVLFLQEVTATIMEVGHIPWRKCWMSNGLLSGVFPI